MKISFIRVLILFVAQPSTVFIGSAHATSFYIRPFSEFTQSAANIVHARLSNVRTENAVTNDGGKTIYTYADADVIEVIKGNVPGANILIRKVGGTKDGVTLEIPSNVEFSDGEESVFFLSPIREDHAYEVTGMELGKFGLKDENGEKVLTGGIFNYSRPGNKDEHQDEAHLAPNLNENLHPWTIKQLKELVKKEEANPAPTPATKMATTPTGSAIPVISQSLPSDANASPPPQADAIKTENETETSGAMKWLIFGGVTLLALAFFFRKK